jgi:hypothetical protein
MTPTCTPSSCSHPTLCSRSGVCVCGIGPGVSPVGRMSGPGTDTHRVPAADAHYKKRTCPHPLHAQHQPARHARASALPAAAVQLGHVPEEPAAGTPGEPPRPAAGDWGGGSSSTRCVDAVVGRLALSLTRPPAHCAPFFHTTHTPPRPRRTHTQALPRPANPSLCELLDGVVISKRRGLEVAQVCACVRLWSGRAGVVRLRHTRSAFPTLSVPMCVSHSPAVPPPPLCRTGGWWTRAMPPACVTLSRTLLRSGSTSRWRSAGSRTRPNT